MREPDPPVVTTTPTVTADQPATTFPDSVIVQGTVNPNGLATTYYFAYDTTSALRFQTPTRDGGSGTAAVSVKATLLGLWPGTVCQWRLVAQNSSGVSWADGPGFLFRPQAPLIENCRGSSSTKGIANLVARINPNRTTTTYRFEYDTLTLYRWQTPEQSLPAGAEWRDVEAAVTNLPGMVFHVRLVATNEGGTSMQEGAPFKVFGNATFRQFDFPLAVGNTWVYRYTLDQYNPDIVGIHTWRTVEHTSGGWLFQVTRSDSVYYSGTLTSLIRDSLSFTITETSDTIQVPFPEWIGTWWSSATRLPRTYVSESDTLEIRNANPGPQGSPYDKAVYCSGTGLLHYQISVFGMLSGSNTKLTLLSYSPH